MKTVDDFGFLSGPPAIAACRLLGCLLVRDVENEQGFTTQLVGRIVETEAYDMTDAASHSYKGRTPRTDVMFGPPGRLYVYFTYGMHYCCNVVTGPVGHGSAVLIRAMEPVHGVDTMIINRQSKARNARPKDVTNGPAKLCQAFAIDKSLNGHDLQQPPMQLQLQAEIKAQDIVQTTRIGITQARDVPWRFYINGNPYISKLATP